MVYLKATEFIFQTEILKGLLCLLIALFSISGLSAELYTLFSNSIQSTQWTDSFTDKH